MSLMLLMLACISIVNYSNAKFICSEFTRDGTKLIMINKQNFEDSNALATIWDIKTCEKIYERILLDYDEPSRERMSYIIDTKRVAEYVEKIFYDEHDDRAYMSRSQILVEDLITGKQVCFSASTPGKNKIVVGGCIVEVCYQGHDKIMFAKKSVGEYSIEIWSTLTGEKLCKLEDGDILGDYLNNVTSLPDNSFSFDGNKLVGLLDSNREKGLPGKVIIWDTNTGKMLDQKTVNIKQSKLDCYDLVDVDFSFSSSGKIVAVNQFVEGEKNHALKYNTHFMNDSTVGYIEPQFSFVQDRYRFNFDANRIVTQSEKADGDFYCGCVVTWDTKTGKKLNELKYKNSGRYKIGSWSDLNLDGTIVMTMTLDEDRTKYVLFDTQTGKQLLEFEDSMN